MEAAEEKKAEKKIQKEIWLSFETESNDNREKILLFQIFSAKMKPTEKSMKKKEFEKPKKKKVKLIKYVSKPLRPAPIPAVPLRSLKGVKIVESEETTMQSGLPLIDPMAKGKGVLIEPEKNSNFKLPSIWLCDMFVNMLNRK